MTAWGSYWLLALTLGLGVPEIIALVRQVRNDTLSENWWGIARHSAIAVGILHMALWWFLYHFIYEPRYFSQFHLNTYTDDITLVVVAFVIGAGIIRRIPNAGFMPKK